MANDANAAVTPQATGSMFVRMLKSQTFQDTSAAGLDTQINTWTAAAGGKRLVAIQHMGDSAGIFATIYYTEG